MELLEDRSSLRAERVSLATPFPPQYTHTHPAWPRQTAHRMLKHDFPSARRDLLSGVGGCVDTTADMMEGRWATGDRWKTGGQRSPHQRSLAEIPLASLMFTGR